MSAPSRSRRRRTGTRAHDGGEPWLSNIGIVVEQQGKDEAMALYERALARSRTQEAAYGHEHTSVASTLSKVGVVLRQQGKLDEAMAHRVTVGRVNLGCSSVVEEASGS